MSFKLRKIGISRLCINLDNPRFPEMRDENSAIRSMLENQNNKLIELAKHIIENGINPNDMCIAVPIQDKKGFYYLFDGNRRLTVLKFLNKPNLIPNDEKFSNLKKQFYKLREFVYPKSLSCNVYNNPEDAYTWVELKHKGENKGAGTVAWNAQQTSNFAIRVKKEASIETQLLNYLKKIGFDEKYKLNLDDVPITNLKRLISDAHVKEVLGLTVHDKCLETILPDDELEKPFVKIIRDFLTNAISVKDIYHKADREVYLQSFSSEFLPNKEKIISKRGLYYNGDKILSGSQSLLQSDLLTNLEPQSNNSIDNIKSNRQSINRKFLIPSGCILKINSFKINSIYKELKCLEVSKFSNGVALLLRAFVEFSLDAYISKYNLAVNTNARLSNKLEVVKEELIHNKYLTDDQVKPISVAISNPNSILSINTMHAYVHNPNMHPTATDLKITWDNIQVFIVKLWELMQ